MPTPKPIGSNVGIWIDSPENVYVGEYLQSKTGRTYHITNVRVQQRGQHIGRQHIRADVIDASQIKDSAKVHSIDYWAKLSAPGV